MKVGRPTEQSFTGRGQGRGFSSQMGDAGDSFAHGLSDRERENGRMCGRVFWNAPGVRIANEV